MGDASHIAAVLLLFGTATADAQVTPPPATAGAYQKLSPGNQKVARALFEAQTVRTITTNPAGKRTGPSASDSSTARPLTLDQIAAMKHKGTGWDSVFRHMRAQSLLSEQNIAQVIARQNHSHPPSASIVTTKSEDASKHDGVDGYSRSGNPR